MVTPVCSNATSAREVVEHSLQLLVHLKRKEQLRDARGFLGGIDTSIDRYRGWCFKPSFSRDYPFNASFKTNASSTSTRTLENWLCSMTDPFS